MKRATRWLGYPPGGPDSDSWGGP